MARKMKRKFLMNLLLTFCIASTYGANASHRYECYIKAFEKVDKKPEMSSFFEDEIVLSAFSSEFLRQSERYSINLALVGQSISIRIYLDGQDLNKTVVSIKKPYFFRTNSSDIFINVECGNETRRPQSRPKKSVKKVKLKTKTKALKKK